MKTTLRRARHDMDQLKKSLTQATEHLKDRANAVALHAIDNAKNRSLAAEHYIHKQPFKTVGIAFVIGSLLGFLFTKR